jgi:aspartate-semialdehyde dehydrogenase
MERRNVGILGATGAVGQRFIQLLADHPWFNITWLAASDRSAGKTYAEACAWRLDTPLPRRIADMVVQPNTPEASSTELPRIIFSSIDAPIARELEPRFAAAGCAVISNSSAFRMAPNVPLVVPEVNAAHLDVIEAQATRKASGGFLVTNPNCCAIGLVLPLAPLHQRFGIEKLFVSTMQAVSGAGYPGVASLDILGNVIPFIKSEEEKLQEEIGKLLGAIRLEGGQATGFQPAATTVSAMCNRVPVLEGHTECVSVKLRKPAAHDEILDAWRGFQPLIGSGHEGHLPSAPLHPVEYADGDARPQPRLDLMRGHGMSTTVGRLRPCSLFDWKFTLLSHNTIRGAAGAAILNAEILAVLGKFDFSSFPPIGSSASLEESAVPA